MTKFRSNLRFNWHSEELQAKTEVDSCLKHWRAATDDEKAMTYKPGTFQTKAHRTVMGGENGRAI